MNLFETGLVAGILFYFASQFTPEYRNELEPYHIEAGQSEDFDLYKEALDAPRVPPHPNDLITMPSFGQNQFFGKGNPNTVVNFLDPSTPFHMRKNLRPRHSQKSVHREISRAMPRHNPNPTRDQGAYQPWVPVFYS